MRSHIGAAQVLGITFGICAATWALCYAAFEYTGSIVPALRELDAPHLMAVASLGATLMMARSPASAVRRAGVRCAGRGVARTRCPPRLIARGRSTHASHARLPLSAARSG